MKTRHALWKKALTTALASAVALGWIPLSYGAATDIADIPLSVKYRPRPNLIIAVDDSGSMDGEVLLSTTTNDGAVWWYTSDKSFWGRDKNDAVATGWVPNFNKGGTQNSTWKKYVYLFPNGQCGPNCDTRSYADLSDDHFAIAPVPEYAAFRSYTYNRVYYNPAVKYDPWLPYSSGGTTVTPAAASPTAARSHPILGTATLDLTTNVNSTSANWTFRMYPGMTMPGGATASTNKYRTCTTTDNGTCGSWTNVGTSNVTVASVCSGTCNHVDVQIQYYPATYYISELDTVAYPLYTTGSGGVSTILSVTPPDGKKLKEVKISTSKNYPKISKAREDCAGAVGATDGCSGAAELQNFANWFQYYRKRHLMLNAGLGNSLSGVKNLRAGYFLFNNNTNATVYDFNSTDVTKNALAFLGSVYKTKGDGGTPTRASLSFLGQQFKRTDKDANGNYNVVQAACQYNAGFVITDGFASDTVTITPNNYDAQSPSATYPYGAQYSSSQTGTVNAGSTNPYKDSYNNTLGDIAMKYYTENLRPDLATGKVTIDENDAGPDADRNRNLHMNTYAIGLGVQGEIFGVNTAATANPYTTTFSWLTDPTSVTRHPSSVDDLWHATIDGRGTMFSANSSEEVRNGLQDVINGVIAKGNGNAAVSVSNSNPTPGDNYTYFSTYNAGSWAGELNARTISLTTGDLGVEGSWNNPGKLLASLTDPLNQRFMATYDPTANKGVAFSWSAINSTQKSLLGNDPDVLGFLRGDRSDEGVKFRSRGARPPFATGVTPDNIAVLGDIVNAEPVFVGQPKRSYSDVGYTAFKTNTTYANRTKVVYQGSNDGMLHAFDSMYGNELWAYLPNLLFPKLKNLSDKTTFKHLYYVDATPASQDVDFNFTYGKTAPTDPSGTDWHTILVGGLGKGGRGYYALDITNPNASTDADVASKVLWEFPNSDLTGAGVGNGKNVGYTYGKPLLLKTKATGWVAMVTSGLNNGSDDADGAGSFGAGTGPGGDGLGHLWVLNPATGKVIKDVATSAGSSGNPSNLLYVTAYARNATIDQTVDFVFGGDMQGNVWVWDFTGASISDWTVTKLATVQDASNNAQPITVAPEVSLIDGKPIVYFGTGQYFGESDVRDFSGSTDTVLQNAASKQIHSVYGIWADWTIDPLSGKRNFVPISGNPRTSALVQRTVTRDCTKLTAQVGTDPSSTSPIDYGSGIGQQRGWFFDMPAASCNPLETPTVGERIMVRPSLTGGVLQVVGNIPNSTDPCAPGGSSWLYSVNYLTGGGVTDSDVEGLFLGSALASRAVMITLPSGKVVSFVRMNASNVSDATTAGGLRDADTFTKGRPVQALDPKLLKLQTKGKRFTWRELFQ